jgi:hypothetical protein
MPDRDTYNYDNDQADNFQKKRSDIYTSVGINAGMAFVNKIQAELTPIKGNFLSLKVNDHAEGKEEKDKELEKVASLANLYKNVSNFDQVISEFYGDLIAGTACLLVQKGTPKDPIIFSAIPIKDVSILEGVRGEIGYTFRQFAMPRENLRFQWAELADMDVGEGEEDKEVTIIECVYKDYETGNYYYYVVDKDREKILVTRESKINNFIVLRWYKGAGELYGRGVGLQALNDVESLNKMTEYDLRASAFALPTFLVQQDATLDPNDFILEPGALNPVPSTATNNPSVIPLAVNTGANITKMDMQVLEMRIKKTMLDNVLPDTVQPGVTATEIVERQEQQKVNISSVFGRLENEFLVPLTINIISILQEFGIVDPEFELDAIDGLNYRVEINTPLSKFQQQGELRGVAGAASIFQQFDPTGQTLAAAFKTPELIAYVNERMGVPTHVSNNAKEIEQKAAQNAQAQQKGANEQANADAERQMAVDTNKEDAKKNV